MILLLLFLIVSAQLTESFYVAPAAAGTYVANRRFIERVVCHASSTDLEAEIRSMRVRDIKSALDAINISSHDVFEKEELIQRLLAAKLKGATAAPASTTTDDNSNLEDVFSVPLYFTSLDSNIQVAASNMNGGIQIDPNDCPYATIEFEVVQADGATFPLRLLLDTACSGFVLRPSVVEKYNLPKLSTPVTMTGAGGTVGATGLTQLNRFMLAGRSFGPLPAAVQDIGALPSRLDGIVGLSFLNQFSAVDFHFEKGQVAFHTGESPSTDLSTSATLVSHGIMEMISQFGIFSVDVEVDGRGPVKMLVDTGAASTFLNWDGVQQLGIARDDTSILQRLNEPMGAMGSDNIAMQLTNRIDVSDTMRLLSGTNGNLPGISFRASKSLKIDIGNIAILDAMKGQNVGGILGIDALSRCKSMRLCFRGFRKEIFLYQ